MSKTTLAIIDCDGGTDDAWALLLFLKACETLKTDGHELILLGITITGSGNTHKYNAARNMLRILKACGREDIPLYFGASEPLLPERFPTGIVDDFLGVDGFGDILPVDMTDTEIDNIIQQKHAVNAIQELCSEHYEKVNLIALGPLTNIALCYAMNREVFAKSVGHIWIMGGNYRTRRVLGHFTEFNFYSDPESAEIVLTKSKCPITILPWEACLYERFPIDIDWRLNEFEKAAEHNIAISILNKVDKSIYSKPNVRMWNPYDLVTMMVFLFEKSFVLESETWHAAVELNGVYTRGQLILYPIGEPEGNFAKIKIIEHVDAKLFKNIVTWLAGEEELAAKFSI